MADSRISDWTRNPVATLTDAHKYLVDDGSGTGGGSARHDLLRAYLSAHLDPGPLTGKIAFTQATPRTLEARFREAPSVEEWPGAVGDNATDCLPAFQKAIADGAWGVRIPGGRKYRISGPITIPAAGFAILGEGYNQSGITCAADIEMVNTPVVSGVSNYNALFSGVTFEDVRVMSATVSRTKSHIHLTNANHAAFHNVHVKTGVNQLDIRPSNSGGIWLEVVGSPPDSWLNQFIDLYMEGCSLIVDTSDCLIRGGIYYGYASGFAILLRNNNIRVEGVYDIVPSPTNGAVWGDVNPVTGVVPNACTVIGCDFDGTTGLPTNFAIFGRFSQLSVLGNYFWNSNTNAIYLTDGDGNAIIGNQFINNNRGGTGAADILIQPGASPRTCYGFKILGNNFLNNRNNNPGPDVRGYVVQVVDASLAYNAICGVIKDNTIDLRSHANGYKPPYFLCPYRGVVGINARTRVNSNTNAASMASGTTTIAVNTLSVAFAHGLSFTPNLDEITVVPNDANTGARTLRWTADATNITLILSSNVTVAATFVWRAERL